MTDLTAQDIASATEAFQNPDNCYPFIFSKKTYRIAHGASIGGMQTEMNEYAKEGYIVEQFLVHNQYTLYALMSKQELS